MIVTYAAGASSGAHMDGPVWAETAVLASTFQTIATNTPMYGLNQIVHAPLTGTAPGTAAVVNVLVWLGAFAGGAVWRFRRDTARV